jgi:hypothetical protein
MQSIDTRAAELRMLSEWVCSGCGRASVVPPADPEHPNCCPRCVPGASGWWITLHLAREIAVTGPRWPLYGPVGVRRDLVTLLDHYIERGGEHPVPATAFEAAAGARG